MAVEYKVTGVLTTGRRFKAIKTSSKAYALSINLYRGTVWYRETENFDTDNKWHIVRRVFN